MRPVLIYITVIFTLATPLVVYAKSATTSAIAQEPVTMMDLGILKLNSTLRNTRQPGLIGAKLGARYDASKGLIEIKVSKDVKKASQSACRSVIKDTKALFVRTYVDKQHAKKKKITNIDQYFRHEGTRYKTKINWNDLPNQVLITAIAITAKNYQHSVFCKSKLMSDKVYFK